LHDYIESVGKQPLQRSGKYPVNENDEEFSRLYRCETAAME
jgi:hypothetical protein